MTPKLPQTASYAEQLIPFTTADGFELNLIRVCGEKPPVRGPVLLVHGAGVRANLFRAPVNTNFVDVLIAGGQLKFGEQACAESNATTRSIDNQRSKQPDPRIFLNSDHADGLTGLGRNNERVHVIRRQIINRQTLGGQPPFCNRQIRCPSYCHYG